MRKFDSQPVVFITEERAVDFSPAAAYGDLRLMDLPKPMPYAEGLPLRSICNDALVLRVKKELADYIPGHDLVCPTGAPVVIAAVGIVLGGIPGAHRLLGWDNYTKRYIEYRFRNKGDENGESQG